MSDEKDKAPPTIKTAAVIKPGLPQAGSPEARKLKDYDAVETIQVDRKGREFKVLTEHWTDETTGRRMERTTNLRSKRFTVTRHEEVSYWYGRFQVAGQKHDDEMVKLWHQSTGRQFKRDTLVIVPSTYLGVARTAILERFRMEPGKPLKVLAAQTSYNFFIDREQGKNGEATEEEFLSSLAAGTAWNKESLAKRTIAQEVGPAQAAQ